jgi:hypothetical protein
MGFRDVKCSYFVDVKTPGYVKDEFGVEYMGKEDIFSGTPIPMPANTYCTISRSAGCYKEPDLSHVDWEAYARRIPRTSTGKITAWLFNTVKYSSALLTLWALRRSLCHVGRTEEAYACLSISAITNVRS